MAGLIKGLLGLSMLFVLGVSVGYEPPSSPAPSNSLLGQMQKKTTEAMKAFKDIQYKDDGSEDEASGDEDEASGDDDETSGDDDEAKTFPIKGSGLSLPGSNRNNKEK